MEALLELKEVAADIGQFHILTDVSFVVPKNSVTVLMGRNGAGKTTTLRTIMGYTELSHGSTLLNGSPITKLQPWRVRRRGIGYVPEDGNIFPGLTVEENLQLGVRKGSKGLKGGKGGKDALDEMMTLFPDLRAARHRLAGHLSGGQRQMLAVASVLIDAPELLLIDEPSKGLSPKFVDILGDAMEQIRKRTTVLLVEQNFQLASRIGDFYVLMEDGCVVSTGEMKELIASPDLQGRYLGIRLYKEEA